MYRLARPTDIKPILSLAKSLDMFAEDELVEIQARLNSYLESLDGSIWIVIEEDGIEGVGYCAPEVMTNGTWNILMLLVRKDAQWQGHGSALITKMQDAVADRQGRLLIVETSGVDDFEKTRRFYLKCEFLEVARIPDFYDAGNDKIVFSKPLSRV